MGVYKELKKGKTMILVVVKDIHMGDSQSSDILEFLHEPYLIFEGEEIYIKAGCIVKARLIDPCYATNLQFTDEISNYDIMFDTEEEYDKYFKEVI